MHLMKLSSVATTAFVVALAAAGAPPASAKPAATVVATYPHGAQISAGSGLLAVAAIDADDAHATLLFASNGGAAPAAADGAGQLPRWAIPHVGTDAGGAVVVTYPRCSSPKVTSCDLYAWDATTHREQRVPGAGVAGVGETEGVLDRGALVVTRWIGSSRPRALVDGSIDAENTTLFFKPAGGRTRKLAAPGGRHLALRGRWIAQVRDTTTKNDPGLCGVASVELVSTTGKTVRTLRRVVCGNWGQVPTGPTFVSGGLSFGVAMNHDGVGQVLRFPVAGTPGKAGPAQHTMLGFAATGPTSGYAVHERHPSGAEEPVFDLERLSALTYTQPARLPTAAELRGEY